MAPVWEIKAQMQLSNPTLSLGYFGQGGIRPGGKVALDFELQSYTKEKTKGERVKTKRTTLFAGPQFALYGRPNYYSSYLAQIRGGVNRRTEGGKFHSSLSAGLGYQLTLELISFDVDFSGKKTNRQREARHYFFPTINYQAGLDLGDRFRVYLGLTYGVQLSGKYEAVSQGFLEGGINYKLYTP